MRKKNRMLRSGFLVAVVAVVGLIVTDAWSQGGVNPGRGRALEELAPLDAFELTDIGPDLSRLEASFDAAQIEQPVADVDAGDPDPDKRVSVLVHFDPPNAGRSAAVAAAQRRDVKAWTGNVGGIVKYEYDIVLPNVINFRDIPSSQLEALRAMPGVVKVEDDREMHAHLTVSTPLIRALQSQITGAGHTADGSGTRVCIVDTGIDTDHIMYSSRIDSATNVVLLLL